jgi:hypothetical protein
MTAHEVPLIFEHNPEEYMNHPRWSGLAPLPEETELRMSLSSMDFAIEGKDDSVVVEDGQTTGEPGMDLLNPPSPPHSPLNDAEGDVEGESYDVIGGASVDAFSFCGSEIFLAIYGIYRLDGFFRHFSSKPQPDVATYPIRSKPPHQRNLLFNHLFSRRHRSTNYPSFHLSIIRAS